MGKLLVLYSADSCPPDMVNSDLPGMIHEHRQGINPEQLLAWPKN